MSKRTTAYMYLLGANLLWGFASPTLKFTLNELSPFVFLSYRFLISSFLALIIFIVLRPKFPKKPIDYAKISLYGFFAVPLALSLLFLGLEQSTVLELGLISAIGPLTTTIGGYLFLKEKVRTNEKVGIAIAVIGTLLTVILPVLMEDSQAMLTGNILLLLFLLSDSTGILLAKIYSKKYDPLVMVNFAFILGAIIVIPLTLHFNGFSNSINEILNLELKYHLGVIYMALFSGTIAYFLFIKGAKIIEAGEASVFFYLTPIFSTPLAVFWLGEKITVPFIMGAVLITIGVFIAEKRGKRRSRT